ncbi:inverse autotransporter beta domain-containing protein [Polystyrenella longa]|uniref:inverse autotransporter beta domain-containing protein n=1 Tax=Polystyrenella longa TaxID=2528007 RepID=UPI0018D23439|nr:inverse autotransporter beta domain-containing protein [Polystyrenella longa]
MNISLAPLEHLLIGSLETRAYAESRTVSDEEGTNDGTTDYRQSRRRDREEKSADGPGVIGRLGYNALQTFGRDDSITNLELMPYMIEDGTMWFTDFRFFLSNDLQYGGNIGLGYRQEVANKTVIGTNFFYDIDETSEDMFHQLGFGLETYAEKWDARANFYFPIGETQGDTRVRDSNYRYSGTSIIYDLERRTNQAYQGVDVEIGYLIPTDFTEDHNVRLFGGLYHFEGDAGEDIDGYKVRLQGDVSESFQTQVEYTSDDTFGNNVMLAIHYMFPSGPGRSKTSRPVNMLEGFVHRNYNVIVADGVENEIGLSVTSAGSDLSSQGAGSGDELTVKHVSSNGTPAGGTHAGSVDDPFESIADAQASGADIILVHGGSVLSETVTVATGQRIYGEGGTYLMQNGTLSSYFLPTATSSSELPTLTNSVGNAFELKSNAEIAGFVVDGAGGYGIYANGSTNGYASNIDIQNSGGGIGLDNVAGTFVFDDITIEGSTGNGVSILNNRADIHLDAGIYDSTGYGMEIVNYSAGSITFDELTFGGSGGQGIYLAGINEDLSFNDLSIDHTSGTALHINGGDGTVTFNGDTSIEDSGNHGLIVENFEGEVSFGTVDVALAGNGDGVELTDNSGSITVDELNVSNENGTGLAISNSDDVTINKGSIETVSGTALDVEGSTVDISLDSVSSSDAQYGIRVVDTDGQVIVFGDEEDSSGGTITGAEAAIYVSGSEKVAFQFMLLDGNQTGLKVVDSNEVYLSHAFIRNVDEWGVDAFNTRLVNIDESLLESNGNADHNRIRFLADEKGAYEFTLSNSILAANDGSAIQIETLAGSAGSTLGVILHSNDVYLANSAVAGLDIDWNGTSSTTLYSNEFVTEDGDKVAFDFDGLSTSKLTSITMQQNLFRLNGVNDTAIDVKTAGESTIATNTNYLFLDESNQTGFLFDLGNESNVAIFSTLLTSSEDSATGALFEHVGEDSNVQFSGNNFALDTSSTLIDRGLIFESIDDILVLTGESNLITGAGEIFSIPTDSFYGAISINNTLVEGDAE